MKSDSKTYWMGNNSILIKHKLRWIFDSKDLPWNKYKTMDKALGKTWERSKIVSTGLMIRYQMVSRKGREKRKRKDMESMKVSRTVHILREAPRYANNTL